LQGANLASPALITQIQLSSPLAPALLDFLSEISSYLQLLQAAALAFQEASACRAVTAFHHYRCAFASLLSGLE
jgi:hypothetical protein